MTIYSVIIADKAAKEIEWLPNHIIKKVIRKLEELEAQPRPIGTKKLTGEGNKWRIRIGDYRVIYKIDDAIRIITILYVRHRKDAYKF